MRRLLVSLGGVVAAIAAASAQAPPPPPVAPPPGAEPVTIVAVHHEPHHRQVFQRGPMRILDLQLPPNDISWFHTHDWPVMYVTLTSSQTRTQNLGMEFGARLAGPGRAAGSPRGGGAAPGPGPAAPPGARGAAAPGGAGPPTPGTNAAAPLRAGGPGRAGGPPGGGGPPLGLSSTTTYVTQPVTHRLQNFGNGLFRALVVVNETLGDDTTTEQAAGFTAKPETTNPWFRAYRIALSPGEKTATHQHRAPVAIIQQTAGRGAGAGVATWEFNQPGQWAFFDVGESHTFTNSGNTRLELIEVEVRRK
jgi:hypothetical protein